MALSNRHPRSPFFALSSLPHRWLLPLLSALPLLAGCTEPQSMGEAAAPIIGGKKDTGDPAVMLLASYPADKATLSTCTAVLVAPTVLLTAAHCVDEANHAGHTFGVFQGADATPYEDIEALAPQLAPAKEVHAHPDYNPAPPFHADIGVVVLAAPLDVTPLVMNRAPLAPSIVGETARIVGYGQLVYDQYNAVKHEATTVVAALPAEDTVVVGDGTYRSCIGDSGGPALVKIAGVETIIGVDSYTDTSGCVEPAHYQRTDVYTDFINVYAPPPEGGGGSGGAGVGGGEDGGGGEGGNAAPGGGCALALTEGGAGERAPLALLLIPLALAALRRRRGN